MPLETLRELARQALPASVKDPESFDTFRRLRDEGGIIVPLPVGHEPAQYAKALLITTRRWRALHGDSSAPLRP